MALDIFGKMDIDLKVVSSDITRSQNQRQNNLYELLVTVPAKPVKAIETINDSSCFSPKTDKHFVPKRRYKLKRVKTVRYIRQLLEKDIYSYLPSELEKQQAVLLKKIKGGSSNDENTKLLAKNMFDADKPLSRSVWDMMIHINPEQNKFSKQFVLWDGKYIQVNGSKGGNNKFICNYDLCKNGLQKQKITKKRILNKRKGLLQHSLSVKFKPGPLRRKKDLDDSHQKYHVGSTELINLPKPGLAIQSTYGIALDQTITNFINHLRDESGVISKKWAEFAVTVLGTERNGKAIQHSEDSCIFDLKYKCNQNRILMRRDIDSTLDMVKVQSKIELPFTSKEEERMNMLEVKCMMDKILDSVEISIDQDHMYSGEEEAKHDIFIDTNINKEKSKRKYCELGRLDVTVIQLPDDNQKNEQQKCDKMHCLLGCVCASLDRPFTLRRHCGLVKCMFHCECDFSKYMDIDPLKTDCSDFIPDLLNLSNEITTKLSKEEQKFHQTVIVSGEKSVLLKPKKRSLKASKKYTDFYSDLNLKTEEKPKKILSVIDLKLNCANIEPWCMVHNLYKCFCKGRFTESSMNENENMFNNNMEHKELLGLDNISEIFENVNDSNSFRTSLRPERKLKEKLSDSSFSESYNSIGYVNADDSNTCARMYSYQGRKYSDGYYKNINNKIMELEINDVKLHKRMIRLLKIDELKDKINTNTPTTKILPESTSLINIMNNITEESPVPPEKASDVTSNKGKLVTWLESSYKHYKQRVNQGIVKTSLDPPKFGKLALYPWDFILSRYRERKNIFLISKQMPYRIFMAIDISHSIFENCLNIDDIRFAELHKYPTTVRNLLTNTTDNMKDNFCILCGLSHCWELIGSVTKVNEDKENNSNDEEFKSKPECSSPTIESPNKSNEMLNEIQTFTVSTLDKPVICEKNEPVTIEVPNLDSANKSEIQTFNISTLDKPVICDKNEPVTIEVPNSDSANKSKISELNEPAIRENPNSDSSKWFVMTIENDFSEIQFYTRGFFVKYESIVKAINVARMSGKTVRLSSQKCGEKNSGPQFGIYAIPNANEYCVFVGPYETHEPLGIETVKSIVNIRKERTTRGVWITTDKIDNLKVIDNPLSYMPSSSSKDFNEMLPLEANSKSIADDANLENPPANENYNTKTDDNKETVNNATSSKTTAKIVKPIKIRKVNGFYRFAPDSLLKKLSLQTYSKSSPLLLKSPVKCNTSLSSTTVSNVDSKALAKKPVAEVAPQIKITAVYSAANHDDIPKTEKRMFILKPEEINNKIFGHNMIMDQNSLNVTGNVTPGASINAQSMDLDIENFLATSEVCDAPNVCIISDDEENSDFKENKMVWIQCENIDNFGWIRGRRNAAKLLSFEFPGFKPTDYYPEEEAFDKITQVLSRKIYLPKHVNLKWQVVESENELKNKDHILETIHLGPDIVLTNLGLRHKMELVKKTRSSNWRTDIGISGECDVLPSTSTVKTSEIISGLRKRSKILENENDLLWNEAITNKDKILQTLSEVSDGLRHEMSETLRNIMLANSDDK